MRLISAVMGGGRSKAVKVESAKNCLPGASASSKPSTRLSWQRVCLGTGLVRRQRSRFAEVDKDVYLTMTAANEDLKASYVLNNTELRPAAETRLSAPLTQLDGKTIDQRPLVVLQEIRKVISSAKLLITLN